MESPGVVAGMLKSNSDACRTLGGQLADRYPPLVVTCARGSSDHAATFAKYLFETQLGVLTASLGPSISSVYKRRLRMEDALFLTISQSGKSPDIVASAKTAKECGAFVLALVNQQDSPLAEQADLSLPLLAGRERSVAATKSFIASLAAVLQLAACWSRDDGLLAALDRLPDDLAAAACLDWGEAIEPIANAGNMFVVGRGLGFGVAQEAALKFKETAELHAEAFSSAEVMHGPLALVGEGFPVIAFTQDDQTREGMTGAIASMRDKGATVFAAEPGETDPMRLPVVPDMHPACAPLAMILSFYRLANRVALARGLDPDTPRHLRKVTETT